MAPGRPRDQHKERQWQRRIDQWRASGLSVRDFCARHRLPTPTFYNWRRRLQHRAAEQASFLGEGALAPNGYCGPACYA
jgi:hypothetical protein